MFSYQKMALTFFLILICHTLWNEFLSGFGILCEKLLKKSFRYIHHAFCVKTGISNRKRGFNSSYFICTRQTISKWVDQTKYSFKSVPTTCQFYFYLFTYLGGLRWALNEQLLLLLVECKPQKREQLKYLKK